MMTALERAIQVSHLTNEHSLKYGQPAAHSEMCKKGQSEKAVSKVSY